MNRPRAERVVERSTGMITGGIIAAVILLIFIFGTFFVVPAGYEGIVLRFGQVSKVAGNGLNAKMPIIDSVVMISVQTQKFEASAQAVSKDLQDVVTNIAINYKPAPGRVGEIYTTIGLKYIDVIAQPMVQGTLKTITAKFNAEDMIMKRAEVTTEIEAALKEGLAKRGIIVENLNITNYAFSKEFTAAIEAKVVAAQNVLQAENKLQQVEVEARQAEQKAKGEAAALIANAQGQATAIQIVTDAQVAANGKISKTLSKDVLQYILIDRLGKDIKVVVIPAGSDIALGNITP